ncbi:MAG: P27 family phage terminase small subunit [Candidatus Paceibacterota bacterium]|jgi:P27 family predicted phage terminase small subunit
MKTKKGKPTPPNLKLIMGNPGKRPLPKGPDLSSDLPDPPEWITGYALDEWNRIANKLHINGYLNDCTRGLFAALCQQYKMLRIAVEEQNRYISETGNASAVTTETTNGNIIQNTIIGTINSVTKVYEKLCTDFGLNPLKSGLPEEKPDKNGKERFFN